MKIVTPPAMADVIIVHDEIDIVESKNHNTTIVDVHPWEVLGRAAHDYHPIDATSHSAVHEC